MPSFHYKKKKRFFDASLYPFSAASSPGRPSLLYRVMRVGLWHRYTAADETGACGQGSVLGVLRTQQRIATIFRHVM